MHRCAGNVIIIKRSSRNTANKAAQRVDELS